jgi:hypothetical protein
VGEITLSHLRDTRIVEDWSGFDSIELLRQLGVLRTLLAAPRLLGALRDSRRRATAVVERRGVRRTLLAARRGCCPRGATRTLPSSRVVARSISS